MTPIVMTFQRVLYDKPGLVTLTTKAVTGSSSTRPSSCRAGGQHLRLGRRHRPRGVRCSSFYLAMVVFGRLDGNFAEEL